MNNYKRKLFIILYFIVLISWLTFIFTNSLSTGEESSAQSNKVVEISQKIVSVFDKDAVVEPAHVRTTAHFFEFLVLGALYLLGTAFLKSRNILVLFCSLGLSLLTALVDETLQLGVEGRGAEVTDVWVDFLGAVVAHLFIIFFYSLFKVLRKK